MQAYVFLRQVEHRIQFLDDQQTHLLPTNDADLDWIARSLGLCDDATAPRVSQAGGLLDRLCEIRELVANEFDALLHDGQDGGGIPPAAMAASTAGPARNPSTASMLLEKPAARLGRSASSAWRDHPRVAAHCAKRAKLRLGRLVQRTGACVDNGDCTEAAALRFIDWLEPLLRRDSYLALLAERPEVLRRLLRLLGLARWPMQYLMRHPGVIDELSDERLLHERFDPDEYTAGLDDRHQRLAACG